jgi:hypothetical protein
MQLRVLMQEKPYPPGFILERFMRHSQQMRKDKAKWENN